MIRLRLLGGARLESDAGAVAGPAAHRHSLALLALLACAPSQTLSRGKLVGYLWPDVPDRTARNRLSTAVHRLRTALGHQALVSVGGDLRLDEAIVSSDVCRFRRALEAGAPVRAVELYRGPFMDGFFLRGSPEFERWLDLEQDRLARAYREALEALAGEAEDRGEPEVAARWWRERSREDPYDSRVTLRLMEALAAAGNRAEALRAARLHERLLDDEVGAEPSADVRIFARELMEPDSRGVGTSGTSIAAGGTGAGPTGVMEDEDRGGDADVGRRGPSGSASAPARARSIAVLPFEAFGSTDAGAAFADGLHNDLLTRLSAVRTLTVISRTSVLRYRHAKDSLPEIARELGAGTILEGGIQHVGGRVRLNVQLIDALSDVHLWAETFDRELTAGDLFEIQSEVAEKIVASLRAELTPQEKERVMEWTPTENLEAYRLHAEGRLRLDERTEAGMRRAMEHFRRALDEDPEYAPAWVGLADSLTLLHEYGYEPAAEALPAAEEAAGHALQVDPRLAAAHASRGLIHEARHEGPQAIRALKRAVELQPSYAEAHNWLSWTYQLLGHPREALDSARRAVELNPLSAEAVSNLAVSLILDGDLEEGLREVRRAATLQPTWNDPRIYEAIALFELGRFGEVREVLDDLPIPWAGSGAELTIALAELATGDGGRARERLRHFEDTGDEFAAAVLHAALGDTERALETLGRVHRWGYWPTLVMHYHYRGALGPLCEHPRFRALLKRVYDHWGLNSDGSIPD